MEVVSQRSVLLSIVMENSRANAFSDFSEAGRSLRFRDESATDLDELSCRERIKRE